MSHENIGRIPSTPRFLGAPKQDTKKQKATSQTENKQAEERISISDQLFEESLKCEPGSLEGIAKLHAAIAYNKW